MDGRAASCRETVEQSPSAQCCHPRRVDQVGRNGVAGKGCLVHEQGSVPTACEMHCGRSPGAPGPHDDDVVLIASHLPQPPVTCRSTRRPTLEGENWPPHRAKSVTDEVGRSM